MKSDRVRASLDAAAEAVRRNQRLIGLRLDQAPVTLDEALIQPPNTDRLRVLYSEWGFKTMLAQLGEAPLTQGALL